MDKRKIGTAINSRQVDSDVGSEANWFGDDSERRKAFEDGVEAARAAFGADQTSSPKKEPRKK